MKLSKRANERIWNALLVEALMEHCERELAGLDSAERHNYTQKFEKNIGRLRHSVGFKEKTADAGKAVWNAVLTLAVIVSVSFFILLTQPEVYAAVENVVKQTFSGRDKLTFQGAEQEQFDDSKRLGYVPEGYFLTNIRYSFEGAVLSYLDENEYEITFEYALADSFSIYIDNDLHEGKEAVINGQVYYAYFPKDSDSYGYSSVIWYADGYGYCLTAQLSYDELIKIAESVK